MTKEEKLIRNYLILNGFNIKECYSTPANKRYYQNLVRDLSLKYG